MPLSVWGKTPVKDGSTPTNITRTNNITDITGGIRPKNGGNLFHSFTNFSIKSGESVRFVHPQGIQNIINRVTGSSASNIHGTIQTLIDGTNNKGNANLFLINPRGIIFGKDVKLDIGGSFVGSTADSIKFLDGSEFSAINPSTEPILTISAPVGLQYGANPGKIQVQGTGNNLDISEGFLNTRNRTTGLQVPDGKSLVLIGGDIQLDGGNLTVKSGRVDLLSVNNGEVSLVSNSNGQIKPGSTQGINYGNIELINAASVDASGISAGNIQLKGQNVFLKDGSALLTNTKGNGVDGVLNVKATELFQVSGISANGKMVSGLFADVAPGAIGKGSDIVIDANRLLVNDGGRISSSTFGWGDTGTLTVKAEDIQVIGISPPGVVGLPLGSSGLFSIVLPGARGNGSNLNIETGSLRVADGALVSTNTFGFGRASDVSIKAENVEVAGGWKSGISQISSSSRGSSGRGGNLLIETSNLRVANGGQIIASTFGTGSAGNLKIRANSVELVGSQDIFLSFSDVRNTKSGLFASAIVGNGKGGDLKITADELIIRDRATINTSNFRSSDPENLRNSAGTGAAGNININSPFILLENQGAITANTNAGDKGNINIQSQNLQLRQDSAISTNAGNSSNGGNITIATDTLTALENSDITANAQQGFGGRVSISAQGIFGTEVRNQLTPESDITASSDLGIQFSGIVEINGVVIDPVSGLVKLKSDVVDASGLIPPSCVAQYRDHKFYLVGRGGHPVAPSDVLGSDTVLVDLGQVTGEGGVQIASVSLPRNTQLSKNLSRSENFAPMVEAQGWVISAEGKVTLTANVPTAKVQNPWIKNPQCVSTSALSH
ncbi:MAG: filamentous hemagglutinin N-terminal domain-containing protein [Calothrix sp. MO_167.B12]|nr:filamentous hemagglutinin N-terminal domain-containing protein [Calothrix sp. MO_167.B12]